MRHVLLLMTALLALAPGCGDRTPATADGGVEAGAVDLAVIDALPEAAPDAGVPGPAVTGVSDVGRDGVALVGEYVDLTGTNFGTGCKVSVGGVEARRISSSQVDLRFQTPEGIPVGANAGTLACDNGQAAFSLTVGRYHLVTVPDRHRVVVLTETAPGVIADSKLRVTVSDPDGVVLSDDSAVAYVATERNVLKAPAVSIVDVVAAGGPRLLGKVPYSPAVKMPIYGLAAAASAPVLALATGLQVLFFDITDPRQPRQTGKVQLVTVTPGGGVPKVSTGFFIDVALSADGKKAVLLDGAADTLHVYDISTVAQPRLLRDKIKVSTGSSARPVISIPGISGILGALKVQGGSAMELALSPDGTRVMALAGGGVGALVPETFNLNLNNTTISVWDLTTNAYFNKLEYLKQAHFPNHLIYAPSGDAYVGSLSSATAVLTKIIFQVAVLAMTGGGLDLKDLGSLLFSSFSDAIDVIKAAWNGKLFDLGGLHRVVGDKASKGKFKHLPYIQAGMCATYDGLSLLSAGQGWIVEIEFGFPRLVKKFVFKYDLGVTLHDLKQDKYKYLSLYSWKVQMLLPPWFFGQAACQQ